jgi:hypothetical protein
MAFDSDLRMLLQSITKASRRPFQSLGVQAQKKAWDEGALDDQPTTQLVAGIVAGKVVGKS